MSNKVLTKKIDFEALVSVKMAAPNNSPDDNHPRTTSDGLGLITDVCIKRKIRNRMQDLIGPASIFVQSDDRNGDGFPTLKKRAEAAGIKGKAKGFEEIEKVKKLACEKWIDVRSFGQVFGFKDGDEKGVSIGVRGPVSIGTAVSADPIEIMQLPITKSVSGDLKENEVRGSDTMGSKNIVNFGLYIVKGAVNVQLAEKTGFTEEDAETLKECLRTLFVNDASAARPEGSMRVEKLFWWEHDCPEGQYPSADVHDLVRISKKSETGIPASMEDYEIELNELDGLKCEVIKGL